MSVFIRVMVNGLLSPVFIEAALSGAGALALGLLSTPISSSISGAGTISAMSITVSHPVNATAAGTGTLSATIP